MDPCPFVRLMVGNLMVKLPAFSLPSAARGVHPFNNTPCHCNIRLCAANDRSFRSQFQTTAVPVLLASPVHDPDPAFPLAAASMSSCGTTFSSPPQVAAAFDLGPSDLSGLARTALSKQKQQKKTKNKPVPPLVLTVEIYTGRRRTTCFGLPCSGRLLGKVTMPVDLRGAELRSSVYYSGWVSLGDPGSKQGKKPEFHLTVRSDPDPRFVFEFGAGPLYNPQVFQLQEGGIRQPVFTCKFSRRTSQYSPATAADQSYSYYRPFSSSTTTLDSDLHPSCSTSWLGSFGGPDGDQHRRRRHGPSADRKGWSVTVHDLSGSPVALASMITPFVPSPGTDRVSRSNPGAWLVLRPGDGTWNPWGRLEAWREPGSADRLGCRLHLIPDANSNNNGAITSCSASVVVADSTFSTKKGGKFAVDLISGSAGVPNSNSSAAFPMNYIPNGGSRPRSRRGSWSGTPTPGCSPRGSGDLSNALFPFNAYRGFVMSSTVKREGKSGRPGVEIGAHNVACTEDAALFVALAAAVDLSMDACAPFSHKLSKELERDQN